MQDAAQRHRKRIERDQARGKKSRAAINQPIEQQKQRDEIDRHHQNDRQPRCIQILRQEADHLCVLRIEFG
jgi:hypothetical protein